MRKQAAQVTTPLLEAALRGTLTEAQARQLYAEGPETVVLALLAASRRIAEQNTQIATLHADGHDPAASPSTPSGMVPVYAKPNTPRWRRRPGARAGHPGARRATPARIDRQEVHRLPRCPHCGGRLQRCQRTRSRVIEDIPELIEPVATEHLIHRDFCPQCQKHVEPVVPDALPHAALGHRVISLTSWFHYGLGVTLDQIVDLLGYHLQTELTPGGLVQAWQRLAAILVAWYEQIGTEAKTSTYLHADETGWRVNGQTCWLWCFANAQVCYYLIDRCRGRPALQKFFTAAFDGVLITDFWAAYAAVEARDRQYCLTHLLRELEKVDGRNTSAEWRRFARHLRRLLRDGLRLKRRRKGSAPAGPAALSPDVYQRRSNRLNRRLAVLADATYRDADARRLAERLQRYREYIFTFLDYAEVTADNNFAERQIRPAVILRKNSQSNRSGRGAATQAVLMSVYRTLKLRGLHPTQTVVQALRIYMQAGQLPPLPGAAIASG